MKEPVEKKVRKRLVVGLLYLETYSRVFLERFVWF
jgi:hypothetical protein